MQKERIEKGGEELKIHIISKHSVLDFIRKQKIYSSSTKVEFFLLFFISD